MTCSMLAYLLPTTIFTQTNDSDNEEKQEQEQEDSFVYHLSSSAARSNLEFGFDATFFVSEKINTFFQYGLDKESEEALE